MRGKVLSVLGATVLAVALPQLAAPLASADSYTYANPTAILPPDGGPSGEASLIAVAGATGKVSDVNVRLVGVEHPDPDELDVALTGPGGQTVVLVSDACGNPDIADLTFTIDDEATGPFPLSDCTTGSFRPTNVDNGTDPFVTTPTGTTLAVFDGADPNGLWTLHVYDAGPAGESATIAGGFALDIQTTDVTSPDTTLTKKPKSSTKTRAKIKFTATEAGARFECKVDKKAFKPCTSPLKLKGLKVGKHKVQVRAVDAAGNVDPTPAKLKWRVKPG